MNKKEFESAVIAKCADVSKKDVIAVIDAVSEAIKDALVAGEQVQLYGIGAFAVKERAERQGKNPATGASITIPASKAIAFKAAKAIKDAVNA